MGQRQWVLKLTVTILESFHKNDLNWNPWTL